MKTDGPQRSHFEVRILACPPDMGDGKGYYEGERIYEGSDADAAHRWLLWAAREGYNAEATLLG